MHIIAIGTTRNEVDLVRLNIEHHLAQGVTRFLIQDNDSTDGTQDLLSQLARQYPVEWTSYRGAFRQDLLLSSLAQRASDLGADWILPVDADELWHAYDRTLTAVLQSTTYGALRVQLVNFIQHRNERSTRLDSLLRMTRRVGQPLGSMQGAEDLVEAELIAYVEHVYHYKWVFRPRPDLRVGWGNHTLIGAAEPLGQTNSIVCYHAPLRSYEVLEAKVDAARPAAELEDYFTIAWHLRRWRRLLWEGRLEQEWRANSYMDDCLDVFGHSRAVVVDHSFRQLAERSLGIAQRKV